MGRNSGGTSNAVLTVRMIVGAYLYYIDYQLLDEVMEEGSANRIVLIAFMILFAIAGGILIVMSARALLGIGKKTPESENTEELPEQGAEEGADDSGDGRDH